MIKVHVLLSLVLLVTACMPIHSPVTNQYQLETFYRTDQRTTASSRTLLISLPEAMAGYQTEQMNYIEKPFELNAFTHNAWVSSPANMLYPLMVQSLQKTNYFAAVVSGPYVDKADYRLDTQLIALQQNFLVKPSSIELVVKVMLTHVNDNRVIGSRIISEHVPCTQDTPYGGVLAANKATEAFTRTLSRWVVKQISMK